MPQSQVGWSQKEIIKDHQLLAHNILADFRRHPSILVISVLVESWTRIDEKSYGQGVET